MAPTTSSPRTRRARAVTPAYDSDGNTTSTAGQTVAYDAQDHVASVTTGTTTVAYTLDALERVIERKVTTGGVLTADDLYGYAGDGAAAVSVTNALSPAAGHISTVAGSASGYGSSGDGGAAASALLYYSTGVAFDAQGDLYIADTGNNRVQEVAATTHSQWGLAMTAGDIYTVAGSASGYGSSGDGGAATSALLDAPIGVALDAQGNLYIADDDNNRVQEVAATTHSQWGLSMTAGDIYTVAGSASGAYGSSGDGGLATSSLLDAPTGVAVDPEGDLYITDEGNNRVQEVAAATGDMSTVAGSASGAYGSSGDGGLATSALLSYPAALALDAHGDLYVSDSGNNRVQEVAATAHTQWGVAMTAGDVYTVAGSATGAGGSSGDGGLAISARLNAPVGVALDPEGDLYIADEGNNRAQEVAAATGDISTVAGSATGSGGSSGDGGLATSALLSAPTGVALDGRGDLYIADSGNNRAQEVAAAPTTYMLALTGGVSLEATGSSEAWYYPNLQGGTAAQATSAGTAVGGVSLYDPFGNALNPLQADSPDGLAYGFEGKHGIGTDTDAGSLVLMGARLYDPVIGRFLQVDPDFGGSANAYDYCGQAPVNCTDLAGTTEADDMGGLNPEGMGADSDFVDEELMADEAAAEEVAEQEQVVTADPRKFSNYAFVTPKAPIFESYGYAPEDGEQLARLYEEQARVKYTAGEGIGGKIDQYGQRITINVDLPGQGAAAGRSTVIKTGWILLPDGSLRLVTPFAGFAS